MKRGTLLKRLKAQGCVFVKHGKKHDVYKNPEQEQRIVFPVIAISTRLLPTTLSKTFLNI